MKRQIRTQLIISFIFLMLLIVGLISLMTMSLVSDHFDKYVQKKHDTTLTAYKNELKVSYLINNGTWKPAKVKKIGVRALQDGLILVLKNTDNKIIWEPSQTLLHRATNTKNIDSMNKKNVAIKINSKKVALVQFSYNDALGYTRHDVAFINDLRISLAGISIFVFLVAIVIAIWIARDLSRPLRQIVSFTQAVASGDYRNQLPQQTQIVEVNELVNVTNELSRQLSKNQALRERLSSDIAHELRTPLTTIQGSLEAMIDGIWPIDEARLVSLNDEVIRLTHLINNIENIASIEHREDKLIKVDTDLSKLIQQVLNNFQSNLEEKRITLDYQTEKIIVAIDPNKINQVITNLLSNAIKFTQTKGKIIIKLKRVADNVVLTIEDNGSGIAEKDVPHVFDHFYMADPARNRQQGGQGIGLAIVKAIVVAHGGSVSVDSELGVGTIFTVKIPLNN